MKTLKKQLEDLGFDVRKVGDDYEISQYTPEGEDWTLYFSKLEEIKNYAENFSPEEEFEMFVEAKKNGLAGVPSYGELWKDQLWKQEILNKII